MSKESEKHTKSDILLGGKVQLQSLLVVENLFAKVFNKECFQLIFLTVYMMLDKAVK